MTDMQPEIPESGLAPIPPSCLCSLPAEKPAGCFLRSTQPTASMHLNSRQGKRLEIELSAVGIKKSKPLTIHSGVVCNMYDNLRRDIVTLMNLEKYVHKREIQRDSLRNASQTKEPQWQHATDPEPTATPTITPTTTTQTSSTKKRVKGDQRKRKR